MNFLICTTKVFLLKHVLALLSCLEFREEFPYVVNKKVNRQCTTGNCNENPLDGYYDVTPRVYRLRGFVIVI